MNYGRIIILFIGFLAFTSPKAWSQISNTRVNEKDPLIANLQVFPQDWAPGQGGNIKIEMTLPDGFHAYEDQFRVVILEPDGFQVAPFKIEPLKKWYDKFSKKERTGIEKKATLTAHIEAPNRFLKKFKSLKLELTYQACSEQFCLFPTSKIIDAPITVSPVEGEMQITAAPEVSQTPTTSFFGSENFNRYLGSSIFAGLIFVFFAGLFTSFTPCIFPMIPITLAVLGNHSQNKSRLQNFITSLVYVLGIATTYSILGLIAASTGGLFGASLGSPIVLSVVCAIFLAMALSMYGLFEIQVPAFIRNRLGRTSQKQNLGGAYLTGMFAGIVASPCVGPVLVAILTYVASTQNKFLGFIYLFTYALGLGLIFIALGLSNQLIKSLPRSGAWMNGSKFILGSLMMVAFYYYLNLLLPERFFDLALGLGLIVIASVFGAFLPNKASMFDHVRKGLMQALLIVGIGHLVFSAFDLRPYMRSRVMGTDSLNRVQKLDWKVYSDEALAEAAKQGKPVIIDFWAEWCMACHELEEKTFTDSRVQALAGKYTLLKFDATQDSEMLKKLRKKYRIQGLPTILFFNPNGVWIDALTLTEFEKAEAFVKRMEKAGQ